MIAANDIGARCEDALDPELQAYLAQDGRKGLINLLTGQRLGEVVDAHQIAAILKLIDQATAPVP